ncbi:MAG: hypothetical protein ACQESX_10715 [Bacteroidota bacterium]
MKTSAIHILMFKSLAVKPALSLKGINGTDHEWVADVMLSLQETPKRIIFAESSNLIISSADFSKKRTSGRFRRSFLCGRSLFTGKKSSQ